MTDFKLVVIDIDGTLLIRADDISPENKAALAELKRRGIAISLCSGRAIQAARTVIDQLQLDGYHIFFDGALVTNAAGSDHIFIKTVSREIVYKAVRIAREYGLPVDVFTATGYYAEHESWVTDLRRDYFKVVPTFMDLTTLPEGEQVVKGTLVVRSAEEKLGAQRLQKAFGAEVHFSLTKTPAYPDVDFINLIAPGVSKRTALEVLIRTMGISLEQVMAIGDGPNDIPIITAAGLGVAMGNASDDVKKAAKYITEDVDHDGLAKAIRKFALS